MLRSRVILKTDTVYNNFLQLHSIRFLRIALGGVSDRRTDRHRKGQTDRQTDVHTDYPPVRLTHDENLEWYTILFFII